MCHWQKVCSACSTDVMAKTQQRVPHRSVRTAVIVKPPKENSGAKLLLRGFEEHQESNLSQYLKILKMWLLVGGRVRGKIIFANLNSLFDSIQGN